MESDPSGQQEKTAEKNAEDPGEVDKGPEEQEVKLPKPEGEDDVNNGAAEEPNPPKPERWTCTKCEEPNKITRNNCNNCNAPRPGTEVKEEPKPAAKAAEKWTCPKCDEPNKAERDRCNNCGWVKRSNSVISLGSSDDEPPAPKTTPAPQETTPAPAPAAPKGGGITPGVAVNGSKRSRSRSSSSSSSSYSSSSSSSSSSTSAEKFIGGAADRRKRGRSRQRSRSGQRRPPSRGHRSPSPRRGYASRDVAGSRDFYKRGREEPEPGSRDLYKRGREEPEPGSRDLYKRGREEPEPGSRDLYKRGSTRDAASSSAAPRRDRDSRDWDGKQDRRYDQDWKDKDSRDWDNNRSHRDSRDSDARRDQRYDSEWKEQDWKKDWGDQRWKDADSKDWKDNDWQKKDWHDDSWKDKDKNDRDWKDKDWKDKDKNDRDWNNKDWKDKDWKDKDWKADEWKDEDRSSRDWKDKDWKDKEWKDNDWREKDWNDRDWNDRDSRKRKQMDDYDAGQPPLQSARTSAPDPSVIEAAAHALLQSQGIVVDPTKPMSEEEAALFQQQLAYARQMAAHSIAQAAAGTEQAGMPDSSDWAQSGQDDSTWKDDSTWNQDSWKDNKWQGYDNEQYGRGGREHRGKHREHRERRDGRGHREPKEKKEKKEKKRRPAGEMPEKLHGVNWEEPRESVSLQLVKDMAPECNWQYPYWDDSRRSYAGFLKTPWNRQQCHQYFQIIRDGTEWLQPSGSKGTMPRKTAWLVKSGCTCIYKYGPFEVEPAEYPPWMISLLEETMPLCGLHSPDQWPNCCNMNLYEDGAAAVGWHSDDEALFQGKFQDILILSLSFGVTRTFELRLNFPEEGEKAVYPIRPCSGDLMTMEGMTQKHCQHRVVKEERIDGPRINLTWRWVVKHTPKCPAGRYRRPMR